MSIVNLWIEEDRALLAVDTMGVDQATGQRFECTKVAVLPHAQSVIAGAGIAGVIHVVAASLLHSPAVADFDSAAEVLTASIDAHFAALLQHLPAIASAPQQEIFLAGYSPRLGRMAAISFKKPSLEGAFARAEVEGGNVLPWAPELGDPPTFDTDEDMAALMQQQIRFTQEHAPQHVCGGHMIAVEITRDRIELRRRVLTV